MTVFHAMVTFDPAPGASVDTVEEYLTCRGWNVQDADDETITVSADFESREDAIRRLDDGTAVLSECGFEDVGYLGPITAEELTS